MENLPLWVIWLIFLLAGAATWVAGISLAKSTDSLDTRWKIGDALGGLILLGIAGSLPEIAVVWSAAANKHFEVILGNLVGGLAIQTLVIVIFDIAGKGKRPLSYHAGSMLLFYETMFAILIATLALVGMFVPATYAFNQINPMSLSFVLAWFGGLFFINIQRKNPANVEETEEKKKRGRQRHERRAVENHVFYKGKPTYQVVGYFLFAAIVTLIAGFALEESGTMIATKMNIGAGIFAATMISLITSLPEISTGIEAIFIGDNHLAISDIMGGNAFMPSIFLLADMVSHKPILSGAQHTDVLLIIVAIVMMGVYAFAFLHPPQKRILRMGWDSIWQILIYTAGMFGFTFIK